MADCYQQQLTNFSGALEEKRPFTSQGHRKVTLLHNNARPYVAKATQDYIFALGWEFLLHAAYSPDMVPFNYYLFRSLQDLKVWSSLPQFSILILILPILSNPWFLRQLLEEIIDGEFHLRAIDSEELIIQPKNSIACANIAKESKIRNTDFHTYK